MKCTVDQSALSTLLNEASKFVANKALQPAFSGYFLEVTEEKLTIRATTGQALYQSSLPATNTELGTALVPANILSSTVKALEKGEVTLTSSPEELQLVQKGVSFAVSLLMADDFPKVPELKEENKMLLPVSGFVQATEQVQVAASKDESKPVLTSLLLELGQPNALVTSDGFRLFRVNVDLSLDKEATLLLPARYVKEVLNILKKSEENVLPVYWNQETGQVIFALPDTFVQVSVVQGDFPNYRGIIPEATSFVFTVDKELFQQRLQQVMVLAKELSSIVIFTVEGEELVLTSQRSSKGISSARLPYSARDGEVPQFACNGAYVLDFLASVDEPDITIQGNDPLKPIIFGVPDRADILYLVMPFKLN